MHNFIHIFIIIDVLIFNSFNFILFNICYYFALYKMINTCILTIQNRFCFKKIFFMFACKELDEVTLFLIFKNCHVFFFCHPAPKQML